MKFIYVGILLFTGMGLLFLIWNVFKGALALKLVLSFAVSVIGILGIGFCIYYISKFSNR